MGPYQNIRDGVLATRHFELISRALTLPSLERYLQCWHTCNIARQSPQPKAWAPGISPSFWPPGDCSSRREQNRRRIGLYQDNCGYPRARSSDFNSLFREARRCGKLTIAYAAFHRPSLVALESGVDVTAHVPMKKTVDCEFVTRMAEQQCIAILTLTMEEVICAYVSRSGLDSKNLRNSVPIAFGKGSNFGRADANTSDFASLLHGKSLHCELEPLDDRGTIEPGNRADMVLVADSAEERQTREQSKEFGMAVLK